MLNSYERFRKNVLKDYDVILSEFEELKVRLEEVVLGQKTQQMENLRIERHDLIKASQNTDWGAIDRKHADVREGFVYVLTNVSMPGLVKLGFTTQSPPSRAKELSNATSVPTPFSVACYWRVKDPYVLEQMIGADLKESNAGKEFYRLSPEHVSKIINEKYSEYVLDD